MSNPLLQSDLHCRRTVLVALMIDLLTPATSPEMKFEHVGLFCCYRRSVDVVVAAENPCCRLVANTGFDCAKFVFSSYHLLMSLDRIESERHRRPL